MTNAPLRDGAMMVRCLGLPGCGPRQTNLNAPWWETRHCSRLTSNL